MIEVCELTKHYGNTRAVNQLSFIARPGTVTGFLGPNGAGKSTTIRMILGLDTPTSGTALVNGRRYTTIDRPPHSVGALIDLGPTPGGPSAADHLRTLAHPRGIGDRRVAEVLEEVGLAAMAGRRIGEFSLAMRQRLGIAGALLGDPDVLLFDEPMTGLDADGLRWIRDLTRSLAASGRTVLVSSHHISELAAVADQLLIIEHGELITETSMRELTERLARDVFVRTPRRGGLTSVLTGMGATVLAEPDGGLSVTGMDSWRIASAAAQHHIPIQELTPRRTSLEDFYRELIRTRLTVGGSP